jgi:ribosomal protein L29
MKKQLFSDIQKMSVQDLHHAIIQRRKTLFQLRIQGNTEGLKSSDVSSARKDIARFKTALTEKSRDGGAKK